MDSSNSFTPTILCYMPTVVNSHYTKYTFLYIDQWNSENLFHSVGASPICGPKLKPLRVSAFKGSAQNDKSGGRKSGSKLPKNSVKIKENEDTTVGPPQANDIPLSYASEANESITSSPAIHNLFKKWLRMLRTQSSGEVVDGILAEDPPPKEISETEHKTQNEDRDGILRIIWCNFLSLNATIKIPLLIL